MPTPDTTPTTDTPVRAYRDGEALSAQHGEIVIDDLIYDLKLAAADAYGTTRERADAAALLESRLTARRQAATTGDTASYDATFTTSWKADR